MLFDTEVRVPIMLDKERTLVFNANTMCAFEEKTGKFFLDTVSTLYEAMAPALKARRAKLAGEDAPIVKALDILKRVPMVDLRALIWAALHEYSPTDEPTWPLTLTQVGRMITIKNIPELFSIFLDGQAKNTPTKEELGESPARSEDPKPSVPSSSPELTVAGGGGQLSIALPEAAFV